MNRESKIWIVIFVVIIITGITSILYCAVLSNTWEQKTKIGTLHEIILYNHFPNDELLVTFEDGTFMLITQNHFGSYAVLSQTPIGTEIEIKYKENPNNKIYVESIKEIENE